MLQKYDQRKLGYAFAILAAVMFGSVSVVAKPLVSSVDPVLLASLVYVISAITLTPFARKKKTNITRGGSFVDFFNSSMRGRNCAKLVLCRIDACKRIRCCIDCKWGSVVFGSACRDIFRGETKSCWMDCDSFGSSWHGNHHYKFRFYKLYLAANSLQGHAANLIDVVLGT